MKQELELLEPFLSVLRAKLEGADQLGSEQVLGLKLLEVADSVILVEICLALEDVALEHGFQFDWTSESAMSRSSGFFRSGQALFEEFELQSKVTSG